jgi:DNA-binding response OmpR family regulator
MNSRILLAEDDPNLGILLKEYLEAKNFEVTLATDGNLALDLFLSQSFDFCILDVMMPKKDGFTLAKDIRTKNPKVPILFLTAKSMSEDTIRGFTVGADDYMTKPFSMEELLMRIKAISKRVSPTEESASEAKIYKIGAIDFYPQKHSIYTNGVEHKLTSKESALLNIFCENLNQNISRTYILKLIWGDDSYFNARSMDVYITKIRKILKEEPKYKILNLHGEGFKMVEV